MLGRAESGRLGELLGSPDSGAEAVADSLFEQLEQSAERSAVTVVSSEALAGRFTDPNERFLRASRGSAAAARGVSLYYVRPQDRALEAARRQWGFRMPRRPSAYVRQRTPRYRYFETFARTRERVPSVSFEPRPSRADLLPSGGVVEDFARRFLGDGGAGVLRGATQSRRRDDA